MTETSWYHLQHGDEIKQGDEYYIYRSVFGPRWYPVLTKDIGRKYDAASMQPIRRREDRK
jgi:hypothetical protein